ncbi:MAG TPA: PfkB family carbohydrate kinase [Ornithinibacter sp.]|uniref:PfkB family carbohydrate kinase n=1 Tax=Ornithinibacter sp. TaxID=2862748 RepID=UPI001B3E64C6|nr:PfkB family carbohydrate kinase [Ornithinibacter sp.]MBP6524312.1 bifunctional hydroxymethylpyrimidine kinase/phosphomethylpyrimidine kinase [Dermatophilaceae bacterium]MBU9943185.1 bifunctional hydroxymethylpyrimidine kinase/phosphomethylpyrimidine kinase [Dermatophilaceae bacterium]HQV81485.1 PfkB family carbohydrate kinase [Ornithinibacter sp.]HQW73035.1 PfkB family carbohydrate kinase [Ornithinibacter sp.]HQX86403.1 PfkB family carbohydrate kinase [Ornithinibacter sp.]
MKLTVREHEIVTLLRADPMLDAAALAERIGSTRAAVSVHLSNLMKKGVVRGRGYLLRPEADTVLVVGGAVLDTKVRTAGAPVLGTSNPGTSSSTVGGVGRNIAENLARLGRPTVLVAPVGDDPAGEAVADRTTAAGVDCGHLVRSPHPTGTYVAVLADSGDLHIAVADMRATDELAVADLASVPGLLTGADALVVDANLSESVVRWLLNAAAEAGVLSILDPVSVAKATAVAPVLDGTIPVHTVTPNVDELSALVGAPVEPDVDAVRVAAALLHERGVSHVWVRRGTAGSLLSIATASTPRVVLVDAPPTDVADVTGAGDSMTAGFVNALLDGADVVEAARHGQVLAALTCASPDTVRDDLTPALVAAHLTPSQPSTKELHR